MGLLININIILALIPFFLLLMFIIQYIFTNDLKYLLFVPAYYFNEFLNITLKRISNYSLPYSITKRPPNYGEITENNTTYFMGTSIFPQLYTTSKLNKPKTTYGFPSGHSQSMIAFAIFSTLYINHYYKNQEENILKYLFVWGLAFAVLWQRWFSNCHTPIQILTGSAVGIGLGYTYFEMYKNII